jgi:hypothetical protein
MVDMEPPRPADKASFARDAMVNAMPGKEKY